MTKKTICPCLAMLCLAVNLFAQTQTLRGTVFDRDTKQELPGATVTVLNATGQLAITDDKGRFAMKNLPVGRHTLRIDYLGYEPLQLEEVLITPARETVVSVPLKEYVADLQTIEVRAGTNHHEPLNEMSLISGRSMTMEELNRHAATFFDPARMALGFAGVTTSGDDILNEIVVRGNSPRGILWRLEGVEIPNPNHFSEHGSSGGGISMLSANAMGTSDFFAGAFPAEFGNALSGVFDIKLRNGNHAQTELAAQIGVLGLDLAVEGPLKPEYDGSYLLNYRYSTLGILEQIGITPGGNGNPDFQDLSFKVRLPTAKAGTFSLFGLGGTFIEEESFLSADGEGQDKNRGRTGIAGLSHWLNLSDRTYLKSVVATTYAGQFYEEGLFDQSLGNGILRNDYDESFVDRTSRFSILLNHKFNRRHVVRIGGVFSLLDYDFNLRERNFELLEENGELRRVFGDTWTPFLNSAGNSSTLQGYLQWKFHLSPKLTLNSGLHFLRFALNEQTSWEPRFGLKWQMAPGQALSVAIGRHSRIESLATYFVQRQEEQEGVSFPNRGLPLQNALHYILAYEVALNDQLHLKVEGYYQDISDMAISADPGSNTALTNEDYFSIFFDIERLIGGGNGRNYGVDLSIEKKFANKYYFLLNGSLFQSEYQTLNREWYQTRFSSNYNLVVIGGKEMELGRRRKQTLGLNGKLIYNGGQRYTPIDETRSLEEQRSVYQEIPFSGRLPAYFRIDLGLSYRWFLKKVVHSLSLNVQNVTDQLNVFRRNEFYLNREKRIFRRDSYQESVIPILSYRVEF